jgi:hypothetical protein
MAVAAVVALKALEGAQSSRMKAMSTRKQGHAKEHDGGHEQAGQQSQRSEQSLQVQSDSDTRGPGAPESQPGIGSSVGQERETGRRTSDADAARERPSSTESMVNNLTGAYKKRP